MYVFVGSYQYLQNAQYLVIVRFALFVDIENSPFKFNLTISLLRLHIYLLLPALYNVAANGIKKL